MAVGRRLNSYSGMRFDIPHLRSIESASSYDFDSLLRGMFTGLGRPYLIRGFKLVIPQVTTEYQNLFIEVADSAVLHSSASESGTILLTPAGLPNEQLSPGVNPKVIGSFQPGAINYVSLDYRRVTDTNTIDQTAGWSPSQQLEYQRSVPIGRVLEYRFIISTSGFSTNLPLYVIKIASNNTFEWATKATPSLFRLGSGGANPDPQNTFNWGNYENTQQTGSVKVNPRKEWVNTDSSINSNPLTVKTHDPENAFNYGDFAITNFKDWMDAVMSRFKEITGSDYWYVDSKLADSSPSIFTTWWDSVGSVMTGAGEISYNLILEAATPTFGKFQLQNGSVTGDLYVQGVDSGTKATLTSYNENQLMINSMTSAAFTPDEVLHARRIFRPITDQWKLESFNFAGTKFARLRRKSVSSSPVITGITSWSADAKVSDTVNLYTVVTVNTESVHGLNVGNTISIQGLTFNADDFAVYRVIDVGSPTEFKFVTGLYLGITGTVTTDPVSTLVRSELEVKNIFTPFYKIGTYESNGANQVKMAVKEHAFVAAQAKTSSADLNSDILTVGDTSSLKAGMLVIHANIPAGAVIVSIASGTTFQISAKTTAAITSSSVSFKEQIIVSGVAAAGFIDSQLNGIFSVEGLTTDNKIIIDIGIPSASLGQDEAAIANIVNGLVEPIIYQSTITSANAAPPQYNVVNVVSNICGGEEMVYPVGPDTLPPLDPASGSYTFDGVIAVSSVLNPVLVDEISYNHTTQKLTVTTDTVHGLSGVSQTTITIYGNQTTTKFARTYKNVSIQIDTPTRYILSGGDLSNNIFTVDETYVNSGSDKIFSKFADNPYPGPVSWSSDIVVKGIIGDLSFVIPQTATIDVSDAEKDSLVANNFNINEATGTAYLQDGEVLYAKIERNKTVSNGAVFETLGGNGLIATTAWITDESGTNLEAGDWIKWQDEDETKWLRIRTINATGFTLETDNKQDPDSKMRPPKSGSLVYCKGSYSKLYVRKHSFVDLSSDIYWLAVRRDNGGVKSKVYFRALEVEAGEVRQVNDNQNSNILNYIGAENEGSANPNYATSGDGAFTYSIPVSILRIDNDTRMVTFNEAPERGLQINDIIVKPSTSQYFTVLHTLSSRTVILKESTESLSEGDLLRYQRVNQFIEDQDNLTLAMRKEDRQAGLIETALKRPVYDENVYLQKIDLSGTGVVKSGDYIYFGSDINNPDALAWVLHGTENYSENIAEQSNIVMPGGKFGSNSILVHIFEGTPDSFSAGKQIWQKGTWTGRTVTGTITSPQVAGGTITTGTELVLPPNRRTQVFGAGYVVFGTHSTYKQSDEISLMGEELLVVVNDGIRHAGVDYLESYGGPKAKIKILRTLPPNTRIRFRVQSSFGSAVAAKAGDASLQSAYNVGATISNSPSRPVQISAANASIGETAQIIRGSLAINGGGNQKGGIFNESGDQGFVIGKEINKPKEIWTGMEAVKTHSSHPDSAWKRKTAAQTVTDDTATVIADSAIEMAEGQAYRIRMNAIARRSDGILGVSSFSIEGTFYMKDGAVYAAGSPISTINGSSGDGYNYAIAFGIQGTAVVLVVYGATGVSIATQWAIGMDWQAVGSAS